MKAFEKSSYRVQVKRLRELALVALEQFAIGRVRELKFIHHGENTTWKVTAVGGRAYLLRIHRNQYHSLAALNEELAWLRALARHKDVRVPIPVRTRGGKWLAEVSTVGIPEGRRVSLLKWTDGKPIERFSLESVFALGAIIGKLQNRRPRGRARHRRYWTADGLVGVNGKMGSIDNLRSTSPQQQKRITRGRRLVLARLKAYERRFPRRMGLIHADLHSGNILDLGGNRFGLIDFDDCGYGFFVYDVLITYISIVNFLHNKKRSDELPEFKDALIAGYRTERPWDEADDKILPYLHMARRLLMLGWLNSRADNPNLWSHFPERRKLALKALKREFGI